MDLIFVLVGLSKIPIANDRDRPADFVAIF
jgi:hypothetical protein